MSVEASVIVTCYNQEPSMRLLLESLDRQTEKNFEVVIADDGSKDGTALLCQAKRSFPLQFITQEDLGYRKAKILNQAIRTSKAEYLIFIDGDVIVGKNFIEDHLRLRKPNSFVAGRRVDLSPQLTQALKVQDILDGRYDGLSLKLFEKETENPKRAMRITNPVLRRLLGYHRPLDILGSNFSAWKKDIVEVNGFNEALESYWGEDGDLYIRLRNSGKESIGAKSMCIQFHLFHPRREPNPETVRKYQEMLQKTDYKRAEHGLSN